MQHHSLNKLIPRFFYNLKQCDTDSITCYIIDNNGYIVISPELKETGQFFGEQRPDIMQRLIYDGIFKEILIFDYQGVCFHNKQKGSNNLGVSLHSVRRCSNST